MKVRERSLKIKRARKRWLIFSGAFLLGLLLFFYFFLIYHKDAPSPIGITEPISSLSKETSPQEPTHQIIEGKIKERSTFSKSLSEKNIPQRWIELIVSKLKLFVNFKKMKGGTYHLIMDMKGDLVKFIFEAGPTEVYEIEKDQKGYTVQRKEVPLETYMVKVGGEIRSSLFESMDAIGEGDQLVISFAEILASEIDFYKDVKEGDQFQLVVEKVYKGKEFIRYGPIHAVEYRRGGRLIRGILYQGEFYNEKGISLRKAFLRAPLRFNRISSRFSQSRKHPILGGILPHFGVDYAAPHGTPVWAVADGKVVSCGWNKGFGKQVVIRHISGYTTYYGHLSGFGSGIRKGIRVKQKQIIGYVGSTGLSTGPHLDYRLAKHGRLRNPLKEIFPTGLPIERSKMEEFQKRGEKMIAWFEWDKPYSKRIEGRN